MIIVPSDIHTDVDKARFGVVAASIALGIECNCKLSSMWRVDIDGGEREIFLELAREEIEKLT